MRSFVCTTWMPSRMAILSVLYYKMTVQTQMIMALNNISTFLPFDARHPIQIRAVLNLVWIWEVWWGNPSKTNVNPQTPYFHSPWIHQFYEFNLNFSDENQEVCNGANIYKEGKDPVIKPDSEYPEWLKTLKTEVTPLEQLSVDDKSYWRRMRKAKIKQQNAMRKQGILKWTF